MRGLIVAGAMALAGCLGAAGAAMAQEAEQAAAESWLPSLITETPEEGFALAVTLARRGVTTTQTDRDVLFGLRPKYAHDPDSLIAASQTIALYFQTVAAANDYWR
jgi:Hexameric tyrosine-coordinated heme protein (HTHP)